MTVADPDRWSEIRRAYTQTSEPVTSICKRFGISTGAMYGYARRASWPKRIRMLDGKKTTRRPDAAGQDDLVARLYEALCKQMTAIEERLMATPDLDDSNATATAERDARTLSTLVRTLEKLIELQGNESRSSEKLERAGAESDAVRFRRELVRRIEEFGR